MFDNIGTRRGLRFRIELLGKRTEFEGVAFGLFCGLEHSDRWAGVRTTFGVPDNVDDLHDQTIDVMRGFTILFGVTWGAIERNGLAETVRVHSLGLADLPDCAIQFIAVSDDDGLERFRELTRRHNTNAGMAALMHTCWHRSMELS